GLKAVLSAAAASTSVATLSYEFFTGKIPTSAGVDYLVSPTGSNANNLNSAYYQAFNLENRYINFAVNLGKNGEGKAAFAAKYGSLSLFDSTREAYKTIFGGTPTDAKVHALIDSRVDYFASYGGDGAAGIGTKAAMVGWLLAEAVKADVGMYAKANDAFLADLADGATFAIDLVGVYGKADYAYAG
ncbi:MAG TPA: alkaline metalloproteinase, partial [Caulobacter sp.]|nr:alkaline metalloproteinase [Caulobacter sp.]